jgi:hypothetical protein
MSGCIRARLAAQRIWSRGNARLSKLKNVSHWITQVHQADIDARFVDYAMYRVRLLKHHGITPYIVFDGGPLPAKKGTEVSRAKYVGSAVSREVELTR